MSQRQTALNLESLEDRCCPTTLSASNGVLTIASNDLSTNVVIYQNDKGDGLSILYDTQTPNGEVWQQQSFFSSFCKSIVLDLNGRQDNVSYNLLSDYKYAKSIWGFFGDGNDHFDFNSGVGWPGKQPSPANLEANLDIHLFMQRTSEAHVSLSFGEVDSARLNVSAVLGEGHNTFWTHLNGDLTGNADVRFYVHGGDGGNDMIFTGGYIGHSPHEPATRVPMRIDKEAKLDINLQGGTGDDTLFLSIYTRNNGQIRHHLDGGGGGVDIILPWIVETPDSTGTVVAY
jgi:hypothetical protein